LQKHRCIALKNEKSISIKFKIDLIYLNYSNDIVMELVIVILLIVFLVGLLSRKKGDNFLDTLSSGCGILIIIVVITAIILIYLALKKH